MEIYAVIVSYNGIKWYDRCLGSLLQSEVPTNIIVIDNASSDNSVAYIQEHFPNVHIEAHDTNLGFAKANNIGIKYAIDHGADYVLLLNQDAWVEKDTITKLVAGFGDNEDAGIISPIHLNGGKTDMDKRFASYLPWEFTSDLYLDKTKNYYECEYVNAAAWLLNRKCIETVGGFDTNLFLHYGEDDNYCQRLRYHGLKLLVSTACTICHDREERGSDNLSDNHRKQWAEVIRKEEIAETWSDINKDYPLGAILKETKLKLAAAKLTFRKQKADMFRERIEILHKVIVSRNINKHKGLNWL